jgi:hypothetical protein
MHSRLVAVVLATAFAVACTDSMQTPTGPGSLTAPVFVQSQHNGTAHHHFTHLNGANEVPVRDTLAQGQALFWVNDDGTEISYKLNVANILNVNQAHIHLGPPTGTGGIVVWLYPSQPPFVITLIPGRTQGTLAEGTFGASRLINALAGEPLSALLDEIRSGNAYVNVHTTQFPPGEIRGQIR